MAIPPTAKRTTTPIHAAQEALHLLPPPADCAAAGSAGTLKGAGRRPATQPKSNPLVEPVRNMASAISLAQAVTGTCPPGTTRWPLLGRKDWTASPLRGGAAGSLSPEISRAGTVDRNGSK